MEIDLIGQVGCPAWIKVSLIVEPLDYQGAVRRNASYLEMDLAIYRMGSLIRAIGSDNRNAGLGQRLVGRCRLRRCAQPQDAVLIDRELGEPSPLKIEIETDICER
jgi:hypothetical protein